MPFRTDEALFDPRTYVPEPCPRCKGWGLLKPGTVECNSL